MHRHSQFSTILNVNIFLNQKQCSLSIIAGQVAERCGSSPNQQKKQNYIFSEVTVLWYSVMVTVAVMVVAGSHHCGCACGFPASWHSGSSSGTGGRGRRARWGTTPWPCPGAERRRLAASDDWRSSTWGGRADCARSGTRSHSPYRGRCPLQNREIEVTFNSYLVNRHR